MTNNIQLSEQLLSAIKLNHNTTEIRNKLKHSSLKKLNQELSSDDLKKTFWINIYDYR